MKTWAFPAALLCTAVLAGCGSNSGTSSTASNAGGAPSGAPAGAKQVGVALLARTDPFYHDMENAMAAEAKAKGISLEFQDGRKDLNTQLSQVENFISQKKDALIICPVDSTGIAGAIQKANQAKIPVFTADIKADKGDVVSHIASDNVAGGRLAGEYMAKLLNGKGKVVILDYPVVASVRERTKGFEEAIKKYPGITIVPDRPSCRGDKGESLTQMENMLQKYPDLDGAFGINDNTALGALKAVEDRNNKHVVIVGYDGDTEARQEILKGTALKADAVQYPGEIGKQTIDVLDAYFHGKTPPKFVPVKVGIIDQKSLQEEAAKK